MDKTKQLITLLICGLFLTACSNNQQTKNTGKYAPQINPKPKYFMTIKGKIDPKLKNKVKLTWIATYYTTNDACRITVNKFEGVHAPRQISKTLTIHPNNLGDFKTTLSLDLLKSGYCGWQIIGVSYALLLHKHQKILDANTGISFSNKASTNNPKIKQIWACNDRRCSLIQNDLTKIMNGELNSQQNYAFEINITKDNRR